jgi:hypothetical protein
VELDPVVVDYLRGAPEVDTEVVYTEGTSRSSFWSWRTV